MACGFGHTVVVLAGGECLTCGWNKAGQCGNGSNADVLTPVQVFFFFVFYLIFFLRLTSDPPCRSRS